MPLLPLWYGSACFVAVTHIAENVYLFKALLRGDARQGRPLLLESHPPSQVFQQHNNI